MSIAAVSRSRVAAITETDIGVTPPSPAFTCLRRASGGLRTNKQTQVIDEMSLDNDVNAIVETGQDISGSYAFEFSYGSFDDLILAPMLASAWSGDVLVNGGQHRSLTFEETVANGAGFAYRRFLGCRLTSLHLDLSARRAISGSVTVVGSREQLDTAQITGATYTEPSVASIVAGAAVGNVGLLGLSPPPIIRSISLDLSRKVETIHDVVSPYGMPVVSGHLAVTGSVSAYFSSGDLYQAFLDGRRGSMTFTAGIASGQKYQFSLPEIRLLDGSMVMGGKNDDLIASLPFQAVYSPAIAGSISITRNVA